MNHGNLGIIEHNRLQTTMRIRLPVDILRILSIYNGNILSGVYYPGPIDRNEKASVINESEADFVLSPIPFVMWPRVGRVRVYLRHDDTESIARFSALLADNKASIVHSEYSRSGHLFATWNLVVVMDIKVDPNSFDAEMGAYPESVERLENLRKKILEFCSQGGFYSGRHFLRQKEAVIVSPLRALAYFFYVAHMSTFRQEEAWAFQPFSLECKNDELIPCGAQFKALIGRICRYPGQGKLTCVYVDVSSSEITLRMALIPQEQEQHFTRLSVDFQRTEPPDTSRGFCAHITSMIPSAYRVWNLTNFTNEFQEWCEIGGARLLVDTTQEACIRPNGRRTPVEEVLSNIVHSNYREGFQIQSAANSLDAEQVLAMIVAERFDEAKMALKYDVFLSYASANSDIATDLAKKITQADLTYFMSEKSLRENTGIDFADEIRHAIQESREMVILCSDCSIGSEWVTTEWGAAWALEKRITPVLYRIDKSRLPDRLRRLQCIDVHSFSSYLNGVLNRKAASKIKVL